MHVCILCLDPCMRVDGCVLVPRPATEAEKQQQRDAKAQQERAGPGRDLCTVARANREAMSLWISPRIHSSVRKLNEAPSIVMQSGFH